MSECTDAIANARNRHLEMWKRQRKWLEDGMAFWMGEYADTADERARKMWLVMQGECSALGYLIAHVERMIFVPRQDAYDDSPLGQMRKST